MIGDNLTVNTKLADSATNQLGRLRAKIKNNNLFLHVDVGILRKVTNFFGADCQKIHEK